MSFSNPFAQQLGSQDAASIEYFSGNPNPQTLAQPELVLVFKNLLRKDQTTREKASAALLESLESLNETEINDELHLAWIQLYVKLCFDISDTVRANSHTILGKMYQTLGKRSTKYLKYTLPCLLCGLYDPTQSVSAAATAAFELTFNTAERRDLVIAKFRGDIEAFCENVILVQTPQTLSDERYISKEESALKYDRIIKQVLDLISNTLLTLDTPAILDQAKLWKLMASPSPLVSRAVLGLATAAIAKVSPEKVFKQVIKSMNKPQPQSAVELVRALLTYTKAHPNLWDETAHTALVNYTKSGSQYPKPFWPLFYNLALLVTPSKALLSSLASLATKAAGATQNDIWGCFLSLCGRAKPAAAELAVSTVATRSERSVSADLISFIAARLQNIKISADLLEPHLKNFNFCLVLAATGAHTARLSQAAANFTLAEAAQLVKYDPNITLAVDLDHEDSRSLLQIAIHSKTANSQEIAAHVMEKDPELVLEHSKGLHEKNVTIDLSSKLNLTDAATLKKAIGAHGGLVDDQSAKAYVLSLATSATEGNKESIAHLSELAASDAKFIQGTLCNTDLGSQLLNNLYIQTQTTGLEQSLESLFNTLSINDSSDAIVEELLGSNIQTNLDILISRAVKSNSSPQEFAKLLLVGSDWIPQDFWPGYAGDSKFPVHYEVGELPEPSEITRVLSIGVYLINLIHRSEQQFEDLDPKTRAKCITDIALISIACVGLEYSGNSEIAQLAHALRHETNTLVLRVDQELLWDLVSSSDSSSAYYAAQLLYPRHKNQNNNEYCIRYRAKLDKDNICAALLAQLNAGSGIHWYDRNQRVKYDALNSGKQPSVTEFSCIDASTDADKFKELLYEMTESADEPLLQQVLLRLAEIEHHHPNLPEESVERILEYGLPGSKLVVLASLQGDEFERELIRAASRLESSESEQNRELVCAFLKHCVPLLGKDTGINFNKSSSDASIGWVFYCCKRGRTIAKYREQLESSKFADTSINISFASPADWLLYLDLVAEYTQQSASTGKKSVSSTSAFSEYDRLNNEIMDYIGTNLMRGVTSLLDSLEFEQIEQVVGDANASTLTLFYRMCTLFGTSVRQWYRENNNRSLQQAVDQCLETFIVPATMRSLAAQVQALRQDGALEATAVSERGREFRAMIDVDETTAQIVITLDPHFPVKNASVEIIGLDGVPEHKKRSWMIEAEYTVQNGSIVNAMRTLVLKVNNFLEGIEPCAICYSVMEGKNLPTKVCTTCKNKYHTECLYKWFGSNKGEKNCPMCRSKM